MILSRTSPSARSATPVSVTTEPLTISSVPSGWTITATMLPVGLLTGMSTRVLPTLLGTLTEAVIPPLADSTVSTVVPSARFSTVSTRPLGEVSAVSVLPSRQVVVSMTVPSGFVSVLVTEPSALTIVSILPGFCQPSAPGSLVQSEVKYSSMRSPSSKPCADIYRPTSSPLTRYIQPEFLPSSNSSSVTPLLLVMAAM